MGGRDLGHNAPDFGPENQGYQNGKQHGFIRLPYSVHRSAYGWIPIPVASIKNGNGPRILLMAGNHGDEYEGQVALGKLIRSLEPAEVSGRIIILPSANFPAAMAGMRTSPLDEGNLNRSFPGDPYGGPTAQIADYISARPAMTMANGHFKPVNLVANRPA